MTGPNPAAGAADPAAPGRWLPVVVLFAGSGCAALVYEVVWLQLLQLTLGSTAVSLGVLLGAFMGGLCLGSVALPRVVSARYHPLRVYAALEFGIAALALAVLFGLPALDGLYAGHTAPGLAGVLLRGAVAAVCLLPPAALMGATLPAVARWTEAGPQGMSRVGLCYAGNIAGGAVGAVLAGFYLLRVHDMPTAVYAAAGLNAALAALALALARVLPYAPAPPPAPGGGPAAGRAGGVYLAVALSGAAALGGEVVWTRLLALLLGGTVYTFSLILAVFLVGLGAGSAVGGLLAGRLRSPRAALGVCQWLTVAAVAWAAYAISGALPYWPILPQLAPSPWLLFQVDLVRCLWAVLPPACLWGASFPLALAAAGGRDPARVAGAVAAANTLGAVAAALVFGLVLVPAVGTDGAQRVIIGLSAAAALAALAPPLWRAAPAPGRRSTRAADGAVLLGLTGVAAWLAWGVEPVPWRVVAYGRFAVSADTLARPARGPAAGDAAPARRTDCLYVGEGREVSVAVTEAPEGFRSFHAAGKVQASSHPVDMRLQRTLGHLPALLHRRPKTVLVVACGAGVTAGCFLLHPDVERVVICDIEPLVPTAVAPMFGRQNYHVADGVARENPRVVRGKQVEVVYDDGRHFLRTTREKFDVITSDPIDPWVKGCAALNTVEYYRACLGRLNPGGAVSLWAPLYESDPETAKSFIGTFLEVFPEGIVWSNDYAGKGYDAVLYGTAGPPVVDVGELHRRLDRDDHAAVRESLREVGFGSGRGVATDLLAAFAGYGPDLLPWRRDAQLNTDRNLRLQYLAGLSLNRNRGDQILKGIQRFRRFPAAPFVGPPGQLRALQGALGSSGRPAQAAAAP